MPGKPRWDRETALLAWLAACVSFLAFSYYFRAGDILIYGDAVAHINIARRVFDSQTPGLLQLGTVWLPLQHLLIMPFVISDWMWRSGVGASIPSMVAYVFTTVGVFRLVRILLEERPAAAWIGAVIFGLNPNLLYLQSVAMTEVLYLALSIWSIEFFTAFVGGRSRGALMRCGWCVLGACLTRYDAWFLASALIIVAFWLRPQKRLLARFTLLALCGPMLWIAYNAAVYRNPLEFANGPYSARAIERRSLEAGTAPHPGSGNILVAGLYFLKSAELNIAGTTALQRLWIAVALVGALSAVPQIRRNIPALAKTPAAPTTVLLLCLPVPFYAWSIAHGSVPIYIPTWWPHTYYNTRYGIELLPALSICGVLGVSVVLNLVRDLKLQRAFGFAALALILLSYASIFRDPICAHEARANGQTRAALEKEVAQFLTALPANSTLLMYLGDHVGVLQQAGIPIRRVINEGNHRVWKRPADPNGLWEQALADPARFVDYTIAFAGDPVSQQAKKTGLATLAVLHVSGQPEAVIYRTGRSR
jgi:hypothetical protein